MYFIVFLLLLPWWRELEFVRGTTFKADTFSAMSVLVQQGKNHLESLTDKANASRYGSCWKNAIAELQMGCKSLSEETQKELALKLTDCFLQMSGYEPVKCDFPKTTCAQKLSDRAFNAYTEFYTHTHSICYFLQSQVWQEEAEKTVNKLSTTSTRVSQQLQEAERLQESLLSHQKESLFLQHDLMENSKGIASFLQSSQQNIESIIGEFQSSTTEQKQLLLDLFENLTSFKSWVINEMSWFSSVAFYICSIMGGFIVTSVSRTRGARLHVLLIFTLNFLFERFLGSISFRDLNKEINLIAATDTLYALIWTFRKFCVFLSVCAVIYCAVNYYDYSVLNYQLLLEIRNQNSQILKYVSSFTNKEHNILTSGNTHNSFVGSETGVNSNCNSSKLFCKSIKNRIAPGSPYISSCNSYNEIFKYTSFSESGLDQIDNKNNTLIENDVPEEELYDTDHVSVHSKKSLVRHSLKSVYNLRSSKVSNLNDAV